MNYKYQHYNYNNDDPNPQRYQEFDGLTYHEEPITQEYLNEKYGNDWQIIIERDYEYTRVYVLYWKTETEKEVIARVETYNFNKKMYEENRIKQNKLKEFRQSKEFLEFVELEKKILQKIASFE